MSQAVPRSNLPRSLPGEDATLGELVEDFFERRLPIAGFQTRVSQREMSLAVAQAIENREKLTVEAGTGTGKSVAYLVPLLLRECPNGKPSVIATKTVQLQYQLLEKDLPLLQSLLDSPKKVVQAKGWNNYVCLRKVATPDEPSLQDIGPHLPLIHDLLLATQGRLTRHETPLDNSQWNRIKADPLDCQKQNCPYFSQCGLFAERRELETADLIVTNHAFLLTDLRLKREGRALLPEASVLVLDEAHRVDDVATEHLAVRYDPDRIQSSLSAPLLSGNDGWLAATRFTFLMTLPDSDFQEWSDLFDSVILEGLRDLDGLSGLVFAEIRALSPILPEPKVSLKAFLHSQIGERVANSLSEMCLALEESADRIAQLCRSYEERFEFSPPAELLRLGQSIARLGYDLAFLLECESSDWVYLLELDTEALVARPVDNSEALSTELFSDFDSVVLTSASLKVAGNFHFFKRRCGLDEEVRELSLPSPFEFARQAFIGIATSGPNPGSEDYPSHLAPSLIELVAGLQGRTLILTTSHRRVMEYDRLLRHPLERLGVQTLAQGREPTSQLLRRFTSNDSSILIGVDTFWEGVDIPGERLSCVVMTRFPFPVPSDVLFQARSLKVENKGGSAFDDLSLPLVGLKLKQGFGRLLRSEKDRGIFLLTDPRASTKSYGNRLLRDLPCRHAVRAPLDELVTRALQWGHTNLDPLTQE